MSDLLVAIEKQNFANKQNEGHAINERVQIITAKLDDLTLLRAQVALDHRDVIAKIRSCHEEVIEAKIRIIEAKSDIFSLNERNGNINEQVDAEERQSRLASIEAKEFRQVAARALQVCHEIRADPENSNIIDALSEHVPGTTVDSLDQDIAAEQSRLEFIHANNPNAMRDFEKREAELAKLREKMGGAETRLGSVDRKITKIRDKWEPELDRLITEISEAFAFNFEQIGCAGQVGVHKHEDFDQWSIEIKVKFR